MAEPAGPVRRREAPWLITGRGEFVDDLRILGCLKAAMVRSPHAHARIRAIDVSAARRAPGVVGVFTAAALGRAGEPMPIYAPHPALPVPCRIRPLATDRARFVGEAVVAIIADSVYRAHDALDLVRVDYEPLPAVVDVEAALAPGAPRIHDELATNVAAEWRQRVGDVEAALPTADVRVRARIRLARGGAHPLEPRGLVVRWDDDRLTVWGAVQMVHRHRDVIAGQLGVPEEHVRVIAPPDVGGGFGTKGMYYQARLRAEGRYLGVGVVNYVEATATVPLESAIVRVRPDGGVTVVSGAAPQGQGHVTLFSHLIGDVLGVDPETIDVLTGDSALVATGGGTYGSRTAAIGGSAALLAGRVVRDKAIRIAAHLLEAAPVDVVCAGGKFSVRGLPSRALGWADVAAAAHAGQVPGETAGLEHLEVFNVAQSSFANGTHAVVLEVDPETGAVSLLRWVVAHDCGRVLQPMIVDGQIHGGVVQGIADALNVQLAYDETRPRLP